jgi:hypothetical protein
MGIDISIFERESLTYAESLGPAMEITEQADADAFFEAYVTWMMARINQTRGEVENVARQNLGYYAGYYDSATMARVNRLYRTTHPIFGSASVTPESALAAGRTLGNRARSTQPTAPEDGARGAGE